MPRRPSASTGMCPGVPYQSRLISAKGRSRPCYRRRHRSHPPRPQGPRPTETGLRRIGARASGTGPSPTSPRPSASSRELAFDLLQPGRAYSARASSTGPSPTPTRPSASTRKTPWLTRTRGEAYCNKGEFDRAIADYDEAVRLDPTLAFAYSTRGEAYRMKGDYERAVSNLTESLRLRPGYEWAKERLEMSKQDLARVQREQEQTTRREDESGSASVACPQCQTQLTVPSFCVGRKVKCPCCLLRLCRFAHRLNPTIVHPAAKCVMRHSLAP